MKSTLAALPLALALLAVAPFAAAQAPPAVEGRTVDGKPFQLASLKGKVVLLMFWSTGCAVCRDKMPELRQNYQGWAGKPFEMVLVSTDRRMKDLDDYEAIITRTVPLKQRFVQLWAGEGGYKDNLGTPAVQLPASFLIDKSGKVVEKYQGRIPAEAWDKIAELL
ncbi:peroxiredoxin family protein [Caenimonas sedimenti]|nr:TlpA disulfide reductase family protein [Caenimonas sedimenti]